MKLLLSAKERLSLKILFPAKGDLLQQTLVKEISERTDVKKEEMEKIGIELTTVGYHWEKEKEAEVEKADKEFNFTETEARFLKEQVKRLDSEKAITQQILDLCLKIQDAK